MPHIVSPTMAERVIERLGAAPPPAGRGSVSLTLGAKNGAGGRTAEGPKAIANIVTDESRYSDA